MKRTQWIGVVMIILTLTLNGTISEAANIPAARIGIVTDGPCLECPELVEIFKKEILAASELEFDISFPAGKTLDGSWTISGVKQAIDHLLSSPDVDLIITLGEVSSSEICKRRDLNKPVIAPFVIDLGAQKLPHKDGASGVKNLNYINTLRNMGRYIQTLRDMAPFNHLVILGDSFPIEAIPEIHKLVRQVANEYTLDVTVVGVETSADSALRQIPASVQAVFVGSLFRLPEDEFQKLADGLIDRKLPSFAFWGRDDVERGLLASMVPNASLQHLARSVAVNILDILRGEDAGTLPVTFSPGEQLTINMATARAIDFYPSLSILTEAELLNEKRRDIQRQLTLEQAVQEAITANLDLSAADRNVAAGQQQVLQARSQLLPQVDIGTQAVAIDEDRAQALGGANPERTWTGSATATQLLYADKVWSNYSVEKYLQDARIEGRDAVRLDTIQAAASAYLNVLRAKTIERIQKDNLKLIRANLERARVRVSIGIAGPEEEYRWETEIANSRQAVLDAESSSLDALNALNRILNHPQQEPVIATETQLSDPLLVVSDKLFFNLVSNPKSFKVFRDFMVQEGLEIAPELLRFDADIAARERVLISAKRDYWLPTFSLQGSVTELFADSGTGTRNQAAIDLNNTEWSAGVYATLPLFEGGGKGANLRKTREELARLKIQRDATAQRIEQRIHNAINLTRTSYPSIGLSRDAADASHRNLNLITDSYARGIKSIIDLLDAQNLALVADQREANAVYNFLVDLMSLQRAVGKFDLFLSDQERDAWLNKMETYFQQAGVDLKK